MLPKISEFTKRARKTNSKILAITARRQARATKPRMPATEVRIATVLNDPSVGQSPFMEKIGAHRERGPPPGFVARTIGIRETSVSCPFQQRDRGETVERPRIDRQNRASMAKVFAQVPQLERGLSRPPGQDWCGRHGRTGSNSRQMRRRSTRITIITNTNPKPPLGP